MRPRDVVGEPVPGLVDQDVSDVGVEAGAVEERGAVPVAVVSRRFECEAKADVFAVLGLLLEDHDVESLAGRLLVHFPRKEPGKGLVCRL